MRYWTQIISFNRSNMLRHFPLFIILLAELVENYKMNELIAVHLYYHPDRVYHPARVARGAIYDRIHLKGRNFDRKFSHLLFCQTLIFLNFLSKPLFCQNKFNNVLSKFIKILSNSDGYLDSLLFCQSLQSCLTEQF